MLVVYSHSWLLGGFGYEPFYIWTKQQAIAGGIGVLAATFVLRNATLVIRQWSIPGILDGAPYTGSLNGSVWSLFPEFGCYLSLAALGLVGVMSGRAYLLVLVTALGLFFHIAQVMLPNAGTPLLPAPISLTSIAGYPVAFGVGACLHIWRAHLAPGWPAAFVLVVITILLLRWGGFAATAPLIVPLLIIHCGLAFSLPLRADWSYGLYIYSFPLQQLLSAFDVVRAHWIVYFGASVLLSLLFAAASWRWVESRFIHRRTMLLGQNNSLGAA